MITQKKKRISQLGMVIFVLGIAAALIYQSISTWGIVESTLFDPGMPVDERLNSLRCPLIITTDEIGIVSASFTNATDRQRTRIVRASISEGLLLLRRELTTNLPLEPGQTRILEWQVTADDAVWGRYVFVRVFTPRSTSLMPSQTGACGILVVNWPGISGTFIATTLLILGLLGPILGLGIWSGVHWPFIEEGGRATVMIILAVLVLVGIYLSFIGHWIPHLVLLIIVFFLLISLATKAITGNDDIV